MLVLILTGGLAVLASMISEVWVSVVRLRGAAEVGDDEAMVGRDASIFKYVVGGKGRAVGGR